jgi:hypothetical protein
MTIMRGCLWLLVVLILAGASVAPAQDAAARADAASMQRKLLTIISRGEAKSTTASAASQKTSITEREVNAYFRLHGPEFLPDGVMEPRVTIERAGRVQARAIVDLDQALKPKERSWLDPLAWLSGKVEVTGTGTLRAANGMGVFTLENATIGGVSVPPAVLQELVSYYSRSSDNPKGFQLNQPFELPSAIRAVETTVGQATVIQ